MAKWAHILMQLTMGDKIEKQNQNKYSTHKNKTNILNRPEIGYKFWAMIKAVTLETIDPEAIITSNSGQRPCGANGGNSYRA